MSGGTDEFEGLMSREIKSEADTERASGLLEVSAVGSGALVPFVAGACEPKLSKFNNDCALAVFAAVLELLLLESTVGLAIPKAEALL